MADTPRTLAELQTMFADSQPDNSITPQDVRDLIMSVINMVDLANQPSYANDAAAAAGGVAVGARYRNGNFVLVRLS